jgi:integration host factor subunit beta
VKVRVHYSVVIKSLLVLRIAVQKPHLYPRDVEKAVKAILDEIVAAMADGDRVELRDFGTFVVKVRKARVGRNPKTGAQVQVPAKVTPAFKPGKEIRKRLNADGPER